MKNFKIFIDSAQWECTSNIVNCGRLYQYFIENGHEIVDDPRESDYIIINSCGVMEGNKEHTLDIIMEHVRCKKNYSFVIVFGCLMDIDRDIVNNIGVIPIGFQDNEQLDTIFFQKKKFEEIKPHCSNTHREKLMNKKHTTIVKPTYRSTMIILRQMHQWILSFPLLVISQSVKKRYHYMMGYPTNCIYIEISKGCTGNCNYCLIKKAKGEVRSRTIQDILKDIYSQYDPTKELILVADDCGCYGVDINCTIIQLLMAIHENFPSLIININYMDPRYLLKYSKEFLKIFQTINIAIMMIPLQSGSQRVLKKMNRVYEIKNVIDIIKQIKKVSPHTMLYSHFIVGHPGESLNDYRETLNASRFFDYAAPFKYSNNKGTVSAEMTDQVPKLICFLRYAFFLLYLNFVVFFKTVDSLKKNHL
jgi:tRNA A37 methylthiotransferase MiaB